MVTKFHTGTSQVMDCQIHTIGTTIRSFLQVWSHLHITSIAIL